MSDVEKRRKVRELWETGKIKIKGSKKSVNNMTDEFVDGVLRDYEEEQLRETNEWVSKGISSKAAGLLCNHGPVRKEFEDELKKDITSNKLAQRDLQLLVGYITPYIPFIGLLAVALTIGEYVVRSRGESQEKEQEADPGNDLD